MGASGGPAKHDCDPAVPAIQPDGRPCRSEREREKTMQTHESWNFESKLKGMSVLDLKTGEKIGAVSDLIIDPLEGRLLGLTVVRPDKATRHFAVDRLRIGKDAVMASEGGAAPLDLSGAFARGVAATEIMGAKLVTEDGRLVGTIQQIHVKQDATGVFYRVAESSMQRLFGGGFYLAGNVPRAYSQDGKRLIVPGDIGEHYAKKNVHELFEPEADQDKGRKTA